MLLNIEGIDGSGKGTQFGLLKDKLKANDISFESFDFPQYGQDSAKLLEMHLQGKMPNLDSYQIAQLFAVDRLEAKPRILQALGRCTLVLMNRYVTSNMVYQAARVDNLEDQNKIINFIDNLEYDINGLPRPTMNIVTAINFALSQQNVDKKEARTYINGRDINEQDTSLQSNVALLYDRLCKERDDFIRIECMASKGRMKTKQAIHIEIWNLVEKLLQNGQVN